MAELSAGKITSEVGYARAEINPNLNTGATIGPNGFDTRIGGAGASISREGVGFHTPVGSIGMRFPWWINIHCWCASWLIDHIKIYFVIKILNSNKTVYTTLFGNFSVQKFYPFL